MDPDYGALVALMEEWSEEDKRLLMSIWTDDIFPAPNVPTIVADHHESFQGDMAHKSLHQPYQLSGSEGETLGHNFQGTHQPVLEPPSSSSSGLQRMVNYKRFQTEDVATLIDGYKEFGREKQCWKKIKSKYFPDCRTKDELKQKWKHMIGFKDTDTNHKATPETKELYKRAKEVHNAIHPRYSRNTSSRI